MINILKEGWIELKPGLNLEAGKKYTHSGYLMIPTPFKKIDYSVSCQSETLQRICLVFCIGTVTRDLKRIETEKS